MNNQVPLRVPEIGNHQQQAFDVKDAVMKECENCSGSLFTQALKLGVISSMSPKNNVGNDVFVKFEVFVCVKCGTEFGQT